MTARLRRTIQWNNCLGYILAQSQRSRGAWLLWWSTGSRFRYTLHIRIILADFGLILTRLSHFLVPFFLDFSNIYSFFVTLAGQIFPACNIANLKWNSTSWKYCIAGWKFWFAGWNIVLLAENIGLPAENFSLPAEIFALPAENFSLPAEIFALPAEILVCRLKILVCRL